MNEDVVKFMGTFGNLDYQGTGEAQIETQLNTTGPEIQMSTNQYIEFQNDSFVIQPEGHYMTPDKSESNSINHVEAHDEV